MSISAREKKSLSTFQKIPINIYQHIILTDSRDKTIIRSVYIPSNTAVAQCLLSSLTRCKICCFACLRRCGDVVSHPSLESSILLPPAPLNPSICQNQILLNTLTPLTLCPDWKFSLHYQGDALGMLCHTHLVNRFA